MNKGIITKIEKRFFIVKTKDADIERLKIRPNIKVGETITYVKKDVYKGFNRISYSRLTASISMVVILAMVSTIIIGNINNSDIIGDVSFDVNPSLSVSINGKAEIVAVKDHSKEAKDILPSDYKGMDLLDFMIAITDASVEKGYLKTNQPILLSYSVDDAQLNTSLLAYVSAVASKYPVMIIHVDQSTTEAAEKAQMSAGRFYVKQLLENQGIALEEDQDYIRNVFNVLEQVLPRDEDGIYRLNSEDQYLIQEENPSELDEIEDETSQGPAVDNDVQQAATETPSEDDNTLALILKEKEAEEQAALLAKQEAIDLQQEAVDRAYQSYLTTNAELKAAESLYDQINSDLEVQNELFALQDEKYQKVFTIENELFAEQATLEAHLASKEDEINQAAKERDALIATTSTDQASVSDLKSDARSIYNSAYDRYKPIADDVTIQIQDQIEAYEAQINATGRASADFIAPSPEVMAAEIEKLQAMLSIISSLSGELTQTEFNYNFVDTYNSAYKSFIASRHKSDALYDQASDLQDAINKVINSANASYDEAIKTIDASYAPDLVRLEEIQNSLTMVVKTKETFQSVLNDISLKINALEKKLSNQTTLVEAAQSKRNIAYNNYLKEKQTLDALLNEE